ncbi:MAG: hypothetical protein JXB48_22900 [Candidatus Latescibacteria bacterium]|nr:hypothetical protein [Candidatus Latescibacterota bacterium]
MILVFAGPFIIVSVFYEDIHNNTTFTVYVRSFSNTMYVLGKAIGIFLSFLGILSICMFIGFLFNMLVYDDSPVSLINYLLYPLLSSVPTLFFILGISFLFGVLIRNKAILTVVIPLLLLIIYSIYGTHYYGLFDIITYHIPFMYSDFTGFADSQSLLLHRVTYLLIGSGMLTLTSFLFITRRLPQQNIVRTVTGTLALIFFTLSFFTGKQYVSMYTRNFETHRTMSKLNDTYASQQNITVSGMELDLLHTGTTITVSATLKVINNTNSAINLYKFSFNNGLVVKSVLQGYEPLQWQREHHLLKVITPDYLQPGCNDSLTINYTGSIDENSCYTDISEIEHRRENTLFVYSLGKKYGYITKNFVLLTRETAWYPVAHSTGEKIVPVSSQNFYNFKLTVHTAPGLTVISQGEYKKNGYGCHIFEPETPLTKVSLVIGQYECRSVVVDSVTYSLYTKPNHNAIYQYFYKMDEDDIRKQIKELKRDIETNLNLLYPFRRLSLIEIPVHFLAYHRFWQFDPETLQPEQVFLPECGVLFPGDPLDIKRDIRSTRFDMNIEKTQCRYFKSIFRSILIEQERDWARIRYRQDSLNSSANLARKTYIGSKPSFMHDYNIFSQFYSFANNFDPQNHPLFTLALGYTIKARIPHDDRFGWGLPTEVLVTRALYEKNLFKMCTDSKYTYVLFDVMRLKAEELFKRLEVMVGVDNLEAFLQETLRHNRFTAANISDVILNFNQRFNMKLEPLIETWQTEQRFPKFSITGLERYKIQFKDAILYQYIFTISNTGQVQGVIRTRLYSAYHNRPIVRNILVEPGQSKKIGIIDTELRRHLYVDTYNSLNERFFILHFYGDRTVNNAEPFDGERIIQSPNERETDIVVDNEKTECVIVSQPPDKFLSPAAHNPRIALQDLHTTIRNPQRRWHEAYYQEFYGTRQNTALIIAAGSGDASVTWKANVNSEGVYEVFVYMQDPMAFRNQQYREQLFLVKDFTYRIHHAEGIENVTIQADKVNQGWVSIGVFNYMPEKAAVELTNKTNGKIVYADAVRWVKK